MSRAEGRRGHAHARGDAGDRQARGSQRGGCGRQVLHRVAALKGTLIPDTVAVEVTRDYGESGERQGERTAVPPRARDALDRRPCAAGGGWRESIVVAIVIPVTILLTLFAANIMGYTLNRVSLFALIFSIGILVDDAIVVIENIARHWGMKRGRQPDRAGGGGGGRGRQPDHRGDADGDRGASADAVRLRADGAHMSPIPANASAAMLFSFFVAVIITPWLMVKVAGRAPMTGHDHERGGEEGGGEEGEEAARAPDRRRPGPDLRRGGTAGAEDQGAEPDLPAGHRGAVLRFARPALHQGCNGQASALRQQVRAVGRHRHAGGGSVEATDAVAQVVARIIDMPEVISAQTHAGTASPFDFNGLVRHYYLRGQPHLGEVQITLSPKAERERPSHDIALDLRDRLADLPTCRADPARCHGSPFPSRPLERG